MCLGENSANHAVHYVNAQLTALWENSVECSQHADKNLKALERVRYDFALREFYVGSKQRSKTTGEPELMFSAVFDKPRIDFICNHEAVLYLTIKEGHFNRDFSKLDLATFSPTRSRNVQIKDLELAVRLDFSINGIRGTSTQIGNGSHLIQLLVLNMASATLASKVAIPDAKDALSFYLKKYLEFLRQAGHHVLFSLPDFDDDGHQVQVEFSLLPHFVRNIEQEITEVYGVSVESINNSLSSKWLKAIMHAEDEVIDHIKEKDAICLAEYRSTWTTIGDRKDIQFWIKFGAPKLKILCKREAILYFTIEELLVFDGNDFTVAPRHSYKDWEVATVVDLVRKVESSITTVEIDMKTLRVCEPLCLFAGFDIAVNWAATLKATIFEFFQYHYSVILEKVSVHIVYYHDNKPVSPVIPHVHLPGGSVTTGSRGTITSGTGYTGTTTGAITDSSTTSTTITTTTGTSTTTTTGTITTGTTAHGGAQVILKETSTGDFDFLQVLSVEGIVEHFKLLWQSYREKTEAYAQCLVKWSYNEDFKASFGALKIKFLSNEKAMIWVHLEDGFLKPLKGEKKCDFMDWSIAFEVDIAIAEHEKVVKKSSSWFERFKESFAWKQHGNQDSRTLHHLGLDFSTAKFVYDKSKFEGLQLGSRTAVGYVRGVVHYLSKYYFNELTLHGHHILYTTPVWKAGSKPPSMGLTSLSFQIYSKYEYTRETVDSSNAVLILLGMTGFRKLPKGRLQYSSEWVVNSKGSVSSGTVCLSRQVFFEERLLKVLASINGTSTIVPNFCPTSNDGTSAAIFTGSDDSEWGLALATWAQRTCSRRKTGKCDWKINDNKGESDYKWQYTDKWSYEHENSHDEKKNGMYKVSCYTKNLLSFPPTVDGSLDIVLKGQVTVELIFKGHVKSWGTKLASNWSSTLSLKSLPGGSGLSIEVVGDSQPGFEIISTDVPLEQLFDVEALQHLLHVELTGLASELRQSFGGVWEHCFPGTGALSLCNPIFNKHGDILFELRPYVPITQVPVVPRSAPRPEAPKKKSWIKRAVDGAQGVARNVGGAITDVLDDGKLNSSHKNGSNGIQSPISEKDTPLATPSIDSAATKGPVSLINKTEVREAVSPKSSA